MYPFNPSEENLKRVFEEGFTVRDIASSLASFDSETPADHARAIMQDRRYRVAGVRVKGLIAGYVEADQLKGWTCGNHLQPFDEEGLLPDTASLSSAVLVLDKTEPVFIRMLGEVGGVITRSDLQKPPVRMWLFGVITILEMALVRIIENRFPDGGWKIHISENRLKKTESLMRERRRRGQDVRMIDCLQFSDKGWVLWKDPELRSGLEAQTRKEWEERVKTTESLRNNLAHSQDIVTHDWPAIVRITSSLDKMAERLGNLENRTGPLGKE
jgi:hypothetical protein